MAESDLMTYALRFYKNVDRERYDCFIYSINEKVNVRSYSVSTPGEILTPALNYI